MFGKQRDECGNTTVFLFTVEFWILYFFDTALLVMIHIPYTQNWAGGHRCSLRHNVCHPATTRIDAYTIVSTCTRRP